MGLNNFLMAAKIEKTSNRIFTQFPHILVKVHCASSATYLTGIG